MQHTITQITSVRTMSINDRDVQGRAVKGRDCEVRPLRGILVEGEGGGPGLVWLSGSLLTPTWPSLFSVKVTETVLNHCSLASWRRLCGSLSLGDPPIRQIMCPHQTSNKIQDVSSCLEGHRKWASQEHAVNCTRTRCRHRLFQTNLIWFWLCPANFLCSCWMLTSVLSFKKNILCFIYHPVDSFSKFLTYLGSNDEQLVWAFIDLYLWFYIKRAL